MLKTRKRSKYPFIIGLIVVIVVVLILVYSSYSRSLVNKTKLNEEKIKTEELVKIEETKEPSTTDQPEPELDHPEFKYQYNVQTQKDIRDVVVKWMKSISVYPIEELYDIYDAAYSTKYPELILSLGSPESGYNTHAYSDAQARGWCQVVWSVWGIELQKHGIAQKPEDLFDPYICAKASEFVIDCYIKISANKNPNLEFPELIKDTLTRYLGMKTKVKLRDKYVKNVMKTLGTLYSLKSQVIITDYKEKEVPK